MPYSLKPRRSYDPESSEWKNATYEEEKEKWEKILMFQTLSNALTIECKFYNIEKTTQQVKSNNESNLR